MKCKALVLVAVIALSTLAFSQAISGALVGKITDISGAVVAGATVEAHNIETGQTSTTTTQADGEYRFSQLPVGRYNIVVTAQGLTGKRTNLIIDLNKTSTADISLQVAGASTTVEVTDQAASLDTTTPQIQTTFEATQAANLPSAAIGLGYLNLSLLSAGVASSGGVGAGTGPSIGGQRPRNNNFTIEGVDNNNKSVTGPLVTLPNDAVANFTLLQNVYSPEFGHSSGGQFNTVVKSGTNNFHGALYEYMQNRHLNAVDVATVRSLGKGAKNPRYDNNRIGGSLGGPIIRNKLFFFGTYEYNPIGQAAVAGGGVCSPTAAGYATLAATPGINATNLAILKQYLAPAPAAGGCLSSPRLGSIDVAGKPVEVGALAFTGPNFQNNAAGVASGDWNISSRDQFRLRYVYNKSDIIDASATLPVFFTIAPTRSHLVTLAEYHTFGATLTNEFRLGFNRTANNFPAGNFKFPGLDSFPNLTLDEFNLQIGPDPNAPQFTIQNLYQASDSLTWTKGKHTLKMGFEYHYYISPQSFTQRARGDYEYSTVDLYLRDLSPDVLGERSTGNPVYYGNQNAAYSFVSDEWRVLPNLTLTLGLRHEYTSPTKGEKAQKLNSAASVPGLIVFDAPRTSRKNFEPRVGFAYTPTFLANTSIRGGFAIAHDVLYDNIGILSLPPQLSGTQDVDLSAQAPNFLASGGLKPGAGGLVTFASIADQRAATSNFIPVNRKFPYSESWNLSVEHLFAKSWTAEVRYVGTRGLHLNVQTRLNRQAKVTGPSDGLPTFLTAPSQAQLDALPLTLTTIRSRSSFVPAYAAAGFTGSNLVSFQPFGDSYYNGLQTQLNRKFERGLQLQAAYTLSHTIDNSTADFFTTFLTPRRPEDFQNFARDRSTSALDRRHRFTFSAVYELPFFKNQNWLLKNVVGNWGFAPIYTYQTPEYATPQSGRDANFNGDTAGDRTIFNPAGVKGRGSDVTALKNSAGQTVAYLAKNSTAQYIRAGLGAYTTSHRNILATRPINNLDLTLVKRLNITEKKALEFQAQFFNLFNHPQFVPGSLNDISSIGASGSDVKNMLIPGNPKFNHPELVFASNARSMQLALKFSF